MGKSGPEYRNGEKGQHLQRRGKVRGFQDEDDEENNGDKKIHRSKKDQRREAA